VPEQMARGDHPAASVFQQGKKNRSAGAELPAEKPTGRPQEEEKKKGNDATVRLRTSVVRLTGADLTQDRRG